MKVYTAAQMREQEQAAVARGSSFEQLMENAGQAAAADILRLIPRAGRALIVCGKGNNGGDGLVVARVLQEQGWQADIVFALGENLSPLAQNNRLRLAGLEGIRFFGLDELPACLNTACYDLIIDGIFGTGFTGSLPGAIAAACRLLNPARGLKIALDIPTGLDCDTAQADADTFRADITYAFAARKPAHVHPKGQDFCGKIICLDIGI
ncbi:MAG: NAD(P)H-hydrate epimerase [Neisseria sp.]|nr:NAD(P)H-hydrate epimerase [Neisseria sp.]